MATTKKKVPVTKLVAPAKKAPAKKAPAKKKVVETLRNEVVFLYDSSGSMNYLANTLIKNANSWLDRISKENKAHGQITNVSRIDFNTRSNVVSFSEPIDSVERLISFYTGGGTALIDAMVDGINLVEKFEKTKNTSMLIVAITDGDENSSSEKNLREIGKLLRAKQSLGIYTFVVMVPPGRKTSFCAEYEIPLDNVTEWETTERGLAEVEARTAKGFANYFGGRSLGQTSSASFYSQTDLSGVTSKDIKKACTDIQNQVSIYEVPKEVQISEFVEAKTGQPYRGKDGKAFYQLTKKEEVQPSKQVLIMEKGKRAVFGGTEARELIGLHNGATDKVTPGNHANYDIFIQSTSNNRALVRGTKLIVKD